MEMNPIQALNLTRIAPKKDGWPRHFAYREGTGQNANVSGLVSWSRVWSVIRFASKERQEMGEGERIAFFPDRHTALAVGLVIAGFPKDAWASLRTQDARRFGPWAETWAIVGQPKIRRPSVKGSWLGFAVSPDVVDVLNAPEMAH